MNQLSLKISKTLHFYARGNARAARRLLWSASRRSLERPIFVVGCSRAGTTLVFKTLSESTEIGSLQRETHDFWASLHPLEERNWNSHALAASDASVRDRQAVSRHFYSHTGRRRIVDKNNQNGLCVPYLYALFPDAHFVYVKRSPGDNIHSLIEGWGKADEFATWSSNLPVPVEVEAGKYRRWCFFLSDGWRNYTRAAIEDVCAFQYCAMNRAILEAAAMIPRHQWTEIVYEDLLRDPVQGFRSVMESCGLRFTARIEQHCRGVLAKPYNAFSEIRADKWRSMDNRHRIERILPHVTDVAAAMGYRL